MVRNVEDGTDTQQHDVIQPKDTDLVDQHYDRDLGNEYTLKRTHKGHSVNEGIKPKALGNDYTLKASIEEGLDVGETNTHEDDDGVKAIITKEKELVQNKIDDYFGMKNCEEGLIKHHSSLAEEATKFTDQIENWFKASECWDKVHNDRLKSLNGQKDVSASPDTDMKSPLQDEEATPVMIGGDVVALYPSMETKSAGAIAYRAKQKY